MVWERCAIGQTRHASATAALPRDYADGYALNEIVVRPAVAADAAGLVALAAAVASEPEGWLLADGGWRTVWSERRYLRMVTRHPDAALFVAELRGTIVGRLSLMRDGHPSSAHVADIGLMVASDHRRQGVGTALLVAAEQWAREAQIDKLELHVFPYNLAAIALYRKAGYEQEGVRRRHFRRAGGELVDAVLMARHLA